MRTSVSAVAGIQAVDGTGEEEAFAMAFRIETKSTQNPTNDVMFEGGDLSVMPNLSSSQKESAKDLHSPLTREPAHREVNDLS